MNDKMKKVRDIVDIANDIVDMCMKEVSELSIHTGRMVILEVASNLLTVALMDQPIDRVKHVLNLMVKDVNWCLEENNRRKQ